MAEQDGKRSRIVFMGTPGFAAKALEHLLASPDHEVVAVYTQPDRPCGRGQKCKASEVKQLALEHGLEIVQPEHFKDPREVELLASFAPDYLVVVAYGLILPQAVLDIPRLLPVNVHASLLPKYRGAAPIQRAIMNGETVTGITIMRMDAGMDTGPMLLQRSLAIDINDTAQTLHDQLADMGGRLLVDALNRYSAGTLHPIPQDSSKATYAAKLTKAEGLIDFSKTAREVHNLIRGVTPWPGAYYGCEHLPGKECLQLILQPGTIGPALPELLEPGQPYGLIDERLAIACKDKLYLVPALCPEHKKAMDARSFWCGYMKNAVC